MSVASAFDPQLGLVGFRYAFLGSAVLGGIGLGIAVRIGSKKAPEVVIGEATSGPGPIAGK